MLDYDGFFIISASSGTTFPQYNYLNSFKLYNPKTILTSQNYEDDHAKEAALDHKELVSDLIHMGVVEQDEDFS